MSKVGNKVESLTNWERVAEMYNSDAPIPYDPEDGPYDPNDDAAVEAYWKNATIIYRGKVIQKGKSGPEANLQPVTLNLSPAVVDCFRSQGDDWEERINETLKRAVGL
jgi:uncharacterized protein (DUF4415 family)